MTLKNLLINLLEESRLLGLPKDHLDSAYEFLSHREYGLCFDTVVVQMHENDIRIDNNFYNLIKSIAKKMDLSESEYGFISELI
nr:MafI family immunity protein [uncultured Mucilaginibacter sp.]